METLSNHSILYAEDNLKVQKEVVEYLSRYFKNVYVANNGKEALEIYKKEKVDSLLLDIEMPFVNGLEVAKEVRISSRTIPIVMITAFIDTDKLLIATELHLCKYLVKPLHIMKFRKMIQKLLFEIAQSKQTIIELGQNFVWNKEKKILYENNKPSILTQKEQTLLELLFENRNQGISFTDIMARLWEDDFEQEVSVESVKLQVCFLRKKLPKNSIKNIYGKGYILNF